MSDPGKRTEIERLLAEADGLLGNTQSPAQAGRSDVERPPALSKTLRIAVLGGGVAAGIIFVVFTFLPFLGAPSGAVAAFVSTFVTVLVVRGAKSLR